jgi:hypothetical protein
MTEPRQVLNCVGNKSQQKKAAHGAAFVILLAAACYRHSTLVIS